MVETREQETVIKEMAELATTHQRPDVARLLLQPDQAPAQEYPIREALFTLATSVAELQQHPDLWGSRLVHTGPTSSADRIVTTDAVIAALGARRGHVDSPPPQGQHSQAVEIPTAFPGIRITERATPGGMTAVFVRNTPQRSRR